MPIWGTADPNEKVTVAVRDQQKTAVADAQGKWMVKLDPLKPGGPDSLSISGSNPVKVDDVLVGEVWAGSGQSNMEFPMAEGSNRGVNNEKSEIAAANYPQIRLLNLAPSSSDFPLDNVAIRHSWSVCTPASVADFSAVGYFFARDLQQYEKIPIGVIDVSWGGTIAEAWTSLNALSADSSLMPVFARRATQMDELSTLLLQEKQEQADYDSAKAAGNPVETPPWRSDPASWKPAGIYNAMIAPLTPLPIKGVIWYQGESNAYPDAVPVYARLFRTLIEDWRSHWGQGDFPFLYVQIANWEPGGLWPDIREAQRQALVLKNTAMAVAIDIGDPDNVHPKDK